MIINKEKFNEIRKTYEILDKNTLLEMLALALCEMDGLKDKIEKSDELIYEKLQSIENLLKKDGDNRISKIDKEVKEDEPYISQKWCYVHNRSCFMGGYVICSACPYNTRTFSTNDFTITTTGTGDSKYEKSPEPHCVTSKYFQLENSDHITPKKVDWHKTETTTYADGTKFTHTETKYDDGSVLKSNRTGDGKTIGYYENKTQNK